MEKEEQKLSSEMLKRKRTKESGSQALIPEEKSKREAPVERLRERNWEGRKETSRKPSTEEPERKHGKPGWEEGERQEARAERPNRNSHCEAKAGIRRNGRNRG